MKTSTIEKRKQLLYIELKKIIDILIQEYEPEKVILFGSMADGNIHEYSDIDLLIIKKTQKRPIDRIMEVTHIINPSLGVDLFVYTPEEFEIMVNEKYTFIDAIIKNGKVIYEKRNTAIPGHLDIFIAGACNT